MKVFVANLSSKGAFRETNQDRVGCFSFREYGLYLVADGVGGHYAGEVASGMLLADCEAWWEAFRKGGRPREFQAVLADLRSVLDECHEKVKQAAPEGEICGSTLVLLWIQGDSYAIYSVGDSRCYQVTEHRWLRPELAQITHDDVYEGTAPESEGKLTQAVGTWGKCEFSLQTGSIQGKTLFALCSDGAYKYCPEAVWKKKLLQAFRGADLGQVVGQLSEAVEKNGSKDNYSMVLVRCEPDSVL